MALIGEIYKYEYLINLTHVHSLTLIEYSGGFFFLIWGSD